MERLRRRIARALEQGSYQGRAARRLSRAWEKRVRPTRVLSLPETTVVAVGGATLGGSGKTPVVGELYRRLSQEGVRAAVVASSYRAKTPRALRVMSHHAVTHVGDEALSLVRSYPEASIYVGKNRQQALQLAARSSDVVIVDALLQTAPRQVDLSVLVVSGDEPWGAGRCPPAGDLRARRDRLLRVSDVLLYDTPHPDLQELVFPQYRFLYSTELTLARSPEGELVGLAQLATRRFGLLTTIARPERVLKKLRKAGVEPALIVPYTDHGRPRRLPRAEPPVEGWLVTPKCASNLKLHPGDTPIWELQPRIQLPDALIRLVLQKLG